MKKIVTINTPQPKLNKKLGRHKGSGLDVSILNKTEVCSPNLKHIYSYDEIQTPYTIDPGMSRTEGFSVKDFVKRDELTAVNDANLDEKINFFPFTSMLQNEKNSAYKKPPIPCDPRLTGKNFREDRLAPDKISLGQIRYDNSDAYVEATFAKSENVNIETRKFYDLLNSDEQQLSNFESFNFNGTKGNISGEKESDMEMLVLKNNYEFMVKIINDFAKRGNKFAMKEKVLRICRKLGDSQIDIHKKNELMKDLLNYLFTNLNEIDKVVNTMIDNNQKEKEDMLKDSFHNKSSYGGLSDRKKQETKSALMERDCSNRGNTDNISSILSQGGIKFECVAGIDNDNKDTGNPKFNPNYKLLRGNIDLLDAIIDHDRKKQSEFGHNPKDNDVNIYLNLKKNRRNS